MLCVIFVIGPLLHDLPTCVLSSIVVVALSPLLSRITELKYLWRFSKSDVVVWVVTAVVTIFWDIITGLVTGMVLALITVVAHTQRYVSTGCITFNCTFHANRMGSGS
ncbi:hypothetical protein COOONC_03245 [Cooperia oncophora]